MVRSVSNPGPKLGPKSLFFQLFSGLDIFCTYMLYSCTLYIVPIGDQIHFFFLSRHSPVHFIGTVIFLNSFAVVNNDSSNFQINTTIYLNVSFVQQSKITKSQPCLDYTILHCMAR